MRLRVLSDLHVDFGGEVFPAPCGEDAVILAGDVREGFAGIDWASRAFPAVPLIYVIGNHEYYGAELATFREEIMEHAARVAPGRLHVLDNAAVVLDGVRFIGATLWTDFELYGSRPEDVERAMAFGQSTMLDYRHIDIRDEQGMTRRLVPRDTLRLHGHARRYLALALASGDPRRTVVVTHHGPHRRSLAPQFATDLTSAGFISDLSRLMGRAALWVHGHTHTSFDYVASGTRVVCNPRGYCRPDGSDCENPRFRWDCVVEV